jgi:hypothetical protein
MQLSRMFLKVPLFEIKLFSCFLCGGIVLALNAEVLRSPSRLYCIESDSRSSPDVVTNTKKSNKKRKESNSDDVTEKNEKQNSENSKRRKIDEHASPAKVGTVAHDSNQDPKASVAAGEQKKKKKKPHKKKLKKAAITNGSSDSYAQVFGVGVRIF